MKIKSQNDKKLEEAKDIVYKKGFYKGIMLKGEFAGQTVQKAKELVKQKLISMGLGYTYYEPQKKCVSRSGDTCVVKHCDQWYINYGAEEDRQKLLEYVQSDKFNGFNDNIRESFVESINWLGQWGCSRSFGLGTKLPWDT